MDILIVYLPQLLFSSAVLGAAWVMSIIVIFIWRFIYRKIFKKGLTKPFTLSDSIGMQTIPLMIYCLIFLIAWVMVFGILNFDILRPIEYLLRRLLSSPILLVMSLSGIAALQILYLNRKRKAES